MEKRIEKKIKFWDKWLPSWRFVFVTHEQRTWWCNVYSVEEDSLIKNGQVKPIGHVEAMGGTLFHRSFPRSTKQEAWNATVDFLSWIEENIIQWKDGEPLYNDKQNVLSDDKTFLSSLSIPPFTAIVTHRHNYEQLLWYINQHSSFDWYYVEEDIFDFNEKIKVETDAYTLKRLRLKKKAYIDNVMLRVESDAKACMFYEASKPYVTHLFPKNSFIPKMELPLYISLMVMEPYTMEDYMLEIEETVLVQRKTGIVNQQLVKLLHTVKSFHTEMVFDEDNNKYVFTNTVRGKRLAKNYDATNVPLRDLLVLNTKIKHWKE